MLSMERGGGETFDLEIARHLQQLGCEVTFLSGVPLFGGARIRNPYSGFRCQVSGFQIRTPYFGWFPWDKVKGGWRLRVADFRMFESRAAAWIRKHAQDFDVIQVCELPFFVAGAKRQGVRVPIVMRLTAPNFYDPLGGMALADAVIASGETVQLVRSGPRLDCHDIPNAVDTELFRPHQSAFRREHGIRDDEFVALYVARFQDFKNHALLVNAFHALFRRVPNAKMVLVGAGPLRPRVERQVRKLGVEGRVLFLGERPFAELPGIYAAADVLAVSSDFESFCFAALEAMASGLPIVTTDCGWVPKLLGDEVRDAGCGIDDGRSCIARQGGLVVPCGDVGQLAEGLALLAGKPETRRAMGEWNREKAVREHGWGASAARLMRMYRELGINEGGAGA